MSRSDAYAMDVGFRPEEIERAAAQHFAGHREHPGVGVRIMREERMGVKSEKAEKITDRKAKRGMRTDD